ncbi:hypothetical protein [Persicobacter diffluens]|uniref:Uncharacterized protein n=1 Tax=Persicobacter diffluens TaxID=981 RepID=A0AAN4VXH7_9BACT|nr:hypothetical protein PEDI_24260 [Persicobacter diffluens]
MSDIFPPELLANVQALEARFTLVKHRPKVQVLAQIHEIGLRQVFIDELVKALAIEEGDEKQHAIYAMLITLVEYFSETAGVLDEEVDADEYVSFIQPNLDFISVLSRQEEDEDLKNDILQAKINRYPNSGVLAFYMFEEGKIFKDYQPVDPQENLRFSCSLLFFALIDTLEARKLA